MTPQVEELYPKVEIRFLKLIYLILSSFKVTGNNYSCRLFMIFSYEVIGLQAVVKSDRLKIREPFYFLNENLLEVLSGAFFVFKMKTCWKFYQAHFCF